MFHCHIKPVSSQKEKRWGWSLYGKEIGTLTSDYTFLTSTAARRHAGKVCRALGLITLGYSKVLFDVRKESDKGRTGIKIEEISGELIDGVRTEATKQISCKWNYLNQTFIIGDKIKLSIEYCNRFHESKNLLKCRGIITGPSEYPGHLCVEWKEGNHYPVIPMVGLVHDGIKNQNPPRTSSQEATIKQAESLGWHVVSEPDIGGTVTMKSHNHTNTLYIFNSGGHREVI